MKTRYLGRKTILILITIIAVLTALISGVIFTVKHYDDDKIITMPATFTEATDEQGSLEVITYQTTMNDGSGKVLTHNATVYLPYEYDENKIYDVMYLMHGRGGSYKTWLGTRKEPRPFKNLMDNMIATGECPPMIVVCPNLPYEYGTDEAIMDGASHEIADDLMPAVEAKYATHAKTADEAGFVASRDHRIMAGFSMGGSTTWHMLKDHLNYFRFFMPFSMAMYYDNNGYSERKSFESTAEIARSIRETGYTAKDFEIFAASGSEDHKAIAADMQVYDLTSYDKHTFQYTSRSFWDGNVMMLMWPDRMHRYTQAFPYIYNGLLHFYGD